MKNFLLCSLAALVLWNPADVQAQAQVAKQNDSQSENFVDNGSFAGSAAAPGWSGAFPLQNRNHLEQTLTLPDGGGNYTLSWSDAGRANGAGAQSYQVSFNGVPLATETVAQGTQWEKHVVNFSASKPGVLRFEGLNGNGDATALIDNIAVTSRVPEPAHYTMLLIGAGLLLLGSQSKRLQSFKV